MTLDQEDQNTGGVGETIRALIVDDYPLMTDLLTALLESLDGVQIVGHALNGLEAVEKIDPLMPDLVILDTEMPRMGGPEAIPLIRAKHPTVRIILMDLHGDGMRRESALESGADGYCDKLELQDRLPAIIRELFPAS